MMSQEDISITQLIGILLKRKRCFFIVFALAFAAGLLMSYVKQPKYQYSQLLEPANYRTLDGRLVFLQPLQQTQSLLEEMLIPQVFRKTNGFQSHISPEHLSIEVFNDTYLKLQITTTLQNQPYVRQLFSLVLAGTVGVQSNLFETQKSFIADQAKRLKHFVDHHTMSPSSANLNNAVVAMLSTINREGLLLTLSSHKFRLKTLAQARYVTPLQISNKPVGMSKLSGVLVSFLLAIFLGIIAVFIAELIQSYKQMKSQVNFNEKSDS